jgi:polar amino acid transport system substrate-binding protein
MTMTRPRLLLLAVAAAAALAGCSAGSGAPSAGAPSFAPARPAGVQDPAVIPSAGPAGDTSCDPLASLSPSSSITGKVDQIRQHGRLKVGVDQNTYLFGFRDPATSQIVGFDIDIARQVAAAILGDPDKVQLVAITSAQRIPYVVDGTVDLVVDTMTINCDRWKQVSFSTDYYDAGQRVLVAKSSPYKGIKDLGGKKVCAAAGSTSIANIAAAASKPIPVAVADWTDCLVLLQQGQVDAISTDDTILAGLAAQDPNLQLVGDKFTAEPYGIAISKQAPELVRFVNSVLERIRSDGTWAQIYTRWLGSPAPQPPAAKYGPAK